MALASMIEAAMPDDGSVIFGKGTAGSVWKSMLAQQIAEQMAKAGGIGIAAQLARGAQTDPASDAPAALTDTGAAAKSLLIAAAERRATATMMPAIDDDPDSNAGSAT
jgi:Rod binding domain-containing protein